jgi:hypothetical protein
MLLHQGEQPRHRQALAGAPGEGLEGGGERLGLVAEGEADPDLTPVEGE